MKVKSLAITLLLVGLLGSAGPALAQPDPCKDLAKLKDLSKLGDLSKLPDLSKLDNLRLPDMSQLARLSELTALAELGDLSAEINEALADLPQLGNVSPRIRSRLLERQQAPPRPPRPPAPPRPPRSRGPEQTEQFSKTFRVGRTGSLDLTNMAGDVVVTGGTGEDIVIEATKRTRQDSDAKSQLQSVTIDAVERAGRVEVRTRYPQNTRDVHVSVDYRVTVPSGADVNLHAVAGDVHVTNVNGALRLDCVSGDVWVENADRIEALKSVSGDVTVTRGGGADVRIATFNGTLTLRNLKVRSLDASTVSGDVAVTDTAADRAVVKTLSGDVDYVCPLAPNGRYEFSAHSGDVRLTPTSNTGFEIDANTFSGEIRTTMSITMKEGQLQERHVRHEIRGTYGDGSALVTVKTFSGDVTVGKTAGGR
jgi:DUF4097 and DUF4098 domain-containing protein YvlB